MKKSYYLLVVFFIIIQLSFAQGDVNVPSKSPRAKVSQDIGLTTISIDYGRPAVNGRKVYNDPSVIPGMQMGSWTAGAGKCTQMDVSHDIKINGKELKAGSYCLFMDIKGDEVMLHINSEYWQEAAFSYNPSKNILDVQLKLESTDSFNEWLEYSFENLQKDGADFVMHWADKKLKLPIKTNLEDNVLSSFSKEMKGKTWFTWRGPYSAAKYAYTANSGSTDPPNPGC